MMTVAQLQEFVKTYGVASIVDGINIYDVEGLSDNAIEEYNYMVSHYREFKQHRDYFEHLIGMNDGP